MPTASSSYASSVTDEDLQQTITTPVWSGLSDHDDDKTPPLRSLQLSSKASTMRIITTLFFIFILVSCTNNYDNTNINDDPTINRTDIKNGSLLETQISEKDIPNKCPPPPISYVLKAEQAKILNEKFESRSTPNYYIKGDLIEAFDQNEDWVKVSYKNGTKFGWIDKRELVPD